MNGQLDVVELFRSSSDEIFPNESYSANVSSSSDFQDGESKNGESKAGERMKDDFVIQTFLFSPRDAVFTAPGGGFLVDLAFVVLDVLEVELSAFKFAASFLARCWNICSVAFGLTAEKWGVTQQKLNIFLDWFCLTHSLVIWLVPSRLGRRRNDVSQPIMVRFR